jgi:hypothetical protein
MMLVRGCAVEEPIQLLGGAVMLALIACFYVFDPFGPRTVPDDDTMT